jgi:hypothetical protein
MIHVTMAEEDVRRDARTGLRERIPQWPQSRAGVEYDEAIAAADLHAGRIAAVARSLAAGARNASAHAPKPNRYVSHPDFPAKAPLPVRRSNLPGIGRSA